MMSVGFFLAVAVTAARIPWAEGLYLGLDGVWNRRAVIEVSNGTDSDWTERAVSVPADRLGLVGSRIAELRLTDECGDAYRVGVSDEKGFVDDGTVPASARIVFPVDVSAHAKRVYALYWDNPKAWEVAEKLEGCQFDDGSAARVIGLESLKAERRGENAPWPKDLLGFGTFRVPVAVANLSDEPSGQVLASFLLADAVHGERDPELILTFEGRRTDGVRYGTRYVFPVELPAHAIRTYYLYVRPGKGGTARSAEMAGSGIVSEILSDQASLEGVALTPREEDSLLRIVTSPLNAARNAALESDRREVAGWDAFGAGREGIIRRIAATGGLVGPHCAELEITSAAIPAWRSIGQRVKVRPGRPYFCGAFARSKELSNGAASLYFNEFDASGKVIREGGAKTSNSVSGTVPWTDLWRISVTRPETAELEMSLSSKSTGVTAMDGILIAEHILAGVGEREYPPTARTEGLVVCVRSNTEKVFPEKPIRNGTTPWRLKLARNETENLQLAVRSGKSVPRLTAEVVTPTNGNGMRLAVETFVVGLVPIDTSTAYDRVSKQKGALSYPLFGVPKGDGWRGLWPDPLVNANATDLAAETTRAFQFAVRAGDRAQPGVYRGMIQWSSGGQLLREDPFEVEVWDFALPERPEFCAGYDIRFDEKGFFLAPGERDCDAAAERVMALMSKYKIAPTAYFADNRFFTRDANGGIVADFARHDEAARRFFNHYRFPDAYVPRTPFYGFGVAAKPQTFLGEKPYEDGEQDRSKLRPGYVRTFQEALRIYWNHMKEMGWEKRVVLYMSDEPRHWTKEIEAQMIALCKMVHAVDPKIPIYSSTWQFRPSWLGSIDVWGGGSYGCFTEEDRETVRKAGGRLWFTTDGQMCIDTPYCAVEQLLPLYAACHRVEKYEFWGVNWVTHNPWRFGWHACVEGGIRFPNGDGFLIYPPRDPVADPTPCASVRLVAARDGVELHAYYRLLEELAGRGSAAAGKLLDECRRLCVIPNAGGRRSTRLLKGDPNVLDRWRERAGELISRCRK